MTPLPYVKGDPEYPGDTCPFCGEGKVAFVSDWREQDPAFSNLQCEVCDSTYLNPHWTDQLLKNDT